MENLICTIEETESGWIVSIPDLGLSKDFESFDDVLKFKIFLDLRLTAEYMENSEHGWTSSICRKAFHEGLKYVKKYNKILKNHKNNTIH